MKEIFGTEFNILSIMQTIDDKIRMLQTNPKPLEFLDSIRLSIMNSTVFADNEKTVALVYINGIIKGIKKFTGA